jgi:hypothetical protein
MAKRKTVAELDAKIAALEVRLAKGLATLRVLKRERRSFVAGLASGQARKNEKRDAEIREKYQAIKASYDGSYGKVSALAREFGLSKRQLLRLAKQGPPRLIKR